MGANTVALNKGNTFKYLGCKDPEAFAMQQIPVGTVVTLLRDIKECQLDEFFECQLPESFPGSGTAQYFKGSELELIG